MNEGVIADTLLANEEGVTGEVEWLWGFAPQSLRPVVIFRASSVLII